MLADAQRVAAERRPAVPAVARVRGQLHRRRQRRDERRRHGRPALRHDARPRARARGGAARRPGVGRAAARAQGQHRLRPQAAVRRVRGHARGRHRRGAAAVPGDASAGHRVGRAADVEAAVAMLGVLRERAPARTLSTWELVSRQALDLVLEHLPGPATRSPARTPGTAWSSSPRAEVEPACDETLEAALGEAVERGLVVDAVVAGSPAQRSALWQLREGMSEAQRSRARPQARRDPADRRARGLRRRGRAALDACCPGSGSSPTATSATATCTTT